MNSYFGIGVDVLVDFVSQVKCFPIQRVPRHFPITSTSTVGFDENPGESDSTEYQGLVLYDTRHTWYQVHEVV